MKAPVFSIDFRKGSNISDQCGIGTPTTNVGFLKNTYGYACFNRGITFPLFDIDLSEDFTEVFAFYFYEEGDLYSDSIIKIEGNECNPYLRINTIKTNRTLVLTYKLSTGAAFNVISIPIIKNKTYFVAFTHNKASRTFNLYINNILYSYIYPSNHNFNKLNSTPIVRPSSSNKIGFYFMKVYDYILNKNDIDKLYEEFIHSKPIFKPINNFNYPKPTIVNEEGLVAAYNMKLVNGILPNIAAPNPANNFNPSQYNGIVQLCGNYNDGVFFYGKGYISSKNARIDLGSKNIIPNNADFTINIIFKSTRYINGLGAARTIIGNRGDSGSLGNGFRIFYYSTLNLKLDIGDGINVPASSDYFFYNLLNYQPKDFINLTFIRKKGIYFKCYINGILIYDKPDIFESIENTNNYFLGSYNNYNSLTGIINDCKIYNRILSENEIKKYHNKFASQIVFYEDFSNYPVGKQPSIWNKITGTWEIKELQISKQFLPAGTKYLNCITSGIIGINSKQAYGTWEFDIYKVNSTNLRVGFINNFIKTSPYYYEFVFTGSQRLILRRNTGDIIYSISNYLELNKWYRIKITRSIEGKFYLYTKSLDFQDTYSLVSTDGGLGTNPVIDNSYNFSNFFVLNFNSGDAITNIKIKRGVEIQ